MQSTTVKSAHQLAAMPTTLARIQIKKQECYWFNQHRADHVFDLIHHAVKHTPDWLSIECTWPSDDGVTWSLSHPCDWCDGQGVFYNQNRKHYAPCPNCEETGEIKNFARVTTNFDVTEILSIDDPSDILSQSAADESGADE